VTLGGEGYWLQPGIEPRVAAYPITPADRLAAEGICHGASTLAVGQGARSTNGPFCQCDADSRKYRLGALQWRRRAEFAVFVENSLIINTLLQ